MRRNQLLLLIAFAVLGVVLVIYEVGRRDGVVQESLDLHDRHEKVQKRLDDMMPKPGGRAPTPIQADAEADDRVILDVGADGSVRYDGTTYALQHADDATRAAAGAGLCAALLREHDARGGATLREADGRSGLELTVRGPGAVLPDTLKRLIDVCGQEPLRAYRFQFDLGGG